MPTPLSYEYVHDWRIRSALFRFHIGSAEFIKLSWKARLNELVWLLVSTALALLAALAHQWALAVLAIGLALWKAVMLVSHFLSLRKAMFVLRESLRRKPSKSIKLFVTDQGLHETDGGVESFAPWPSVDSFFLHRNVLGIRLKNGLWALVPESTLSASSSSIDALVMRLEERAVPRASYKNAPAHTVP